MDKREELSSILDNVADELTAVNSKLFYQVASDLSDFLEKHSGIEGDPLLESVAELASSLEEVASAAEAVESALAEIR